MLIVVFLGVALALAVLAAFTLKAHPRTTAPQVATTPVAARHTVTTTPATSRRAATTGTTVPAPARHTTATTTTTAVPAPTSAPAPTATAPAGQSALQSAVTQSAASVHLLTAQQHELQTLVATDTAQGNTSGAAATTYQLTIITGELDTATLNYLKAAAALAAAQQGTAAA